MNYIVMDLEWNQPILKANLRPQMPFEIIEIGAVKLDESFSVIDEYDSMIKPVIYPKLHYKVKDLLGYNENRLRNGRKFRKVSKEFFSWCGDNYVFCTWGCSDLVQLQHNLDFYKSPKLPKPLNFYNIQFIYGIFRHGKSNPLSLETAVNEMDIEKDLNFHCALNDARYTATIMQQIEPNLIYQNISTDYYDNPKNKKEEIRNIYTDHFEYVSREFNKREDIFCDKEVKELYCYKCNKMASKTIKWFASNSNLYYSIGKCKEHGKLFGKIRVKTSKNNKYYVIKEVYIADEEKVNEIEKRYDDIKNKKRELH